MRLLGYSIGNSGIRDFLAVRYRAGLDAPLGAVHFEINTNTGTVPSVSPAPHFDGGNPTAMIMSGQLAL